MTKMGKQAVNYAGQMWKPQAFASNCAAMGIYVHWPFCVSRCPYCDFNSHVARAFDDAAYLQAIRRELDHMAQLSAQLPVATVFFGGGTPSLMQPSTVGAILAHIRSRFQLAPRAEITMEANPSSVEASRFAALAEAGVNRLSLGVQSFDDAALKMLGRPHSAAEAIAAIELARQAFARMSFDMIFARHRQTLASWREELARGIDLTGGHLSAYQLTIEQGTRYHTLFETGQLRPPEGAEAERFFDVTREVCDKAGLSAYEISNYALPGEQSRHNLIYWRYQPYIGVGPGAHGRISNKDGERWASSTLRSPGRWLQQVLDKGHGLQSLEALTPAEQADEMLLMGMRLSEGVDLSALKSATGHQPDERQVAVLMEQGLIELADHGRYLRATEPGIKRLNPLISHLAASLRPLG